MCWAECVINLCICLGVGTLSFPYSTAVKIQVSLLKADAKSYFLT